MPDKKLTDNEIKKDLQAAMEWFAEHGRNTNTAIIGICERALDLINRPQAENSNLTSNLTSLQNDLTSAKAEVERMKQTPKCMYAYDGETVEYCVEGPCSAEKLVETIKSEAYKEFAEKLCEDRLSNDPVVIAAKCLLKELTNEQPPNDVKCIDCEHLEINKAWGVCAEAYKMVHPNDCCGKGKLRERVGDDE